MFFSEELRRTLLSIFNSVDRYINTLKLTIGHIKFIHAITLFLCAYILRLIPEFMVGKYPIGNDTITFYAPYIAKFRFDLLNMFYWGHLTSWLFLKFNYVISGGNPFLTLKIVGPELYGFLIISFYEFLTSLKWSRKKSFLISVMLLLQVPTLRLSWDLFHNVAGLSFMFFALSGLSNISRSKENEKRFYTKFAIFSVLTALTHQMTAFLLFSIAALLMMESLVKKTFDLRMKGLINSLMPAFLTFVLILVLPKFIPNNANPFQISYVEPMMEQAGTTFFVNYLDFMSYSDILNRVSLTFFVAYAPLIPLMIIGYKHEELPPLLKYYLVVIFICTFSPLATGVSLFHWDRWMWFLVFPFCIYAFRGISFINQRISKLKLRALAKKSIRVIFITSLAFLFIFISFEYVTRPLSDPFVLYSGFPSKWYLPETMQKTVIPFGYIPDLENCVRWLDSNVKGHCAVLFETTLSGFVLLSLTPRSNVTLISYYWTDFDEAFQESLRYEFNFTYFIGWTKYGIPSNNPDIDFIKIYSSGSLSVYVRPKDFKPPFLTADTNLLRFKNGTYIEVSDNSKLCPSTFTVEFWAKPISFQKWGRWMGKSMFTSDKKEGWEIMWGDDFENPSIFMAMWNENGIEKRSQFIGAPLNQWVHITLVFNGTHIISYRNGNLNGVIDISNWTPMLSDEPFRIGKAFGDIYYDGFFASLRFYNRTLSPTEIAYNLLGDVTHDGLVLEFDFVDRGSSVMLDLSGEGNNGTIVNYEDN